ncbi:MAG: MFS transporter [Herpetosiphonaceae bacterium]|nr:MFS transporter [Herpetosiphonaceae bacterium]
MNSPRRWLVLGWACLGVLLAAADLTALTTLIPQMTFDLEVPLPGGLNDVAWVVSAYLISNIVALPLSGRLADRFDRRLVLIGSLCIFMLGSMSSALAPSLWLLVAARALQGVGAGALVPITMALATDLLPRSRWPLAFGLIAAVDTVGWALGPLYGALFVSAPGLTWRGLFWANVPVALLAAAGSWYALRDLQRTPNRRPIDLSGAALLTLGLLTLNLGLGKLGGGASSGISFDAQPATLPWQAALPWVVSGVVLLALFVVAELHVKEPLINLRWLLQPHIAAAGLVNVLFGALLITAAVNVPLFVNAVSTTTTGSPEAMVRSAALQSGLLLIVLTGLMALCAPLGGSLAGRIGPAPVLLAGALCAMLGFWLMRSWTAATLPLVLRGHLALVGLGFGFLLAPPAAVIIAAAPAGERGLASSLVILLRLSGMSLGLSALTAWSLARFNILSTGESLGGLTAERIQQITVNVLTSTFTAATGLALLIMLLGLVRARRGIRTDTQTIT